MSRPLSSLEDCDWLDIRVLLVILAVLAALWMAVQVAGIVAYEITGEPCYMVSYAMKNTTGCS